MSSPTSIKSINSLPDLCIVTILDRMTLHDLLTNAPLVSTTWYRLAQWARTHRTELTVVKRQSEISSWKDDAKHLREQLKAEFCLQQGSSSSASIIDPSSINVQMARLEHNQLHCFDPDLRSWLVWRMPRTGPPVDRLGSLLPSITRLSVEHQPFVPAELGQVVTLLGQWPPGQLRHLRLVVVSTQIIADFDGWNAPITALIDQLNGNSMSGLESFQFDYYLPFHNYHRQLRLPPSLRRFGCHLNPLTDRSINDLRPDHDCQVFQLKNLTVAFSEVLRRFPHPVTSARFRSLNIDVRLDASEPSQIAHFAQRFSNLSMLSLDLANSRLPVSSVLRAIAPSLAPSLVHLYLCIDGNAYRNFNESEQSGDQFPRFPAIKGLSLELMRWTHENTDRALRPDHCFPAVQLLELNFR